MKTVEQHGDHTDIEYVALTDGSVVHNVVFRLCPGPNYSPVIRFGCMSEAHAVSLADALEGTGFSELEGVPEPAPLCLRCADLGESVPATRDELCDGCYVSSGEGQDERAAEEQY